jgi:hypothetical protein
MHKAYQRSPTKQQLTFILNANIRLAAQHSIDSHTIAGLIDALKQEKKKRSRSKRLNLCREAAFRAQFYSPCTVQQAKAYSNQKEAEEQLGKDRIAAKKITAAANKLVKEQAKEARRIKAVERRRIAGEKKLQYKADVQARKELREAARQSRRDRIPPKKVTKPAQKPRETIRQAAVPSVVVPNNRVVPQV